MKKKIICFMELTPVNTTKIICTNVITSNVTHYIITVIIIQQINNNHD